ncbi:hypothetical protein [Methylobacter sp.]
MNTEIYKFTFLMNETVAVGALAETEEQAVQRLEKLFGPDETYEKISVTFSHRVGDFSIASHKERKEARRLTQKAVNDGLLDDLLSQPQATALVSHPSASGEDLMDNVLSAYAKDKKITL